MKNRIQQIKSILRKQQLEKEFERRRRILLANTIQEQRTQEPNAGLNKQFEQTLDTITRAINERNGEVALQLFSYLIKIVETNSEASTCLFIHSIKVSQLIQLVFRNQFVSQNNSKYRLLSPQMEIQMTDCILSLLYKINYNSLDQDTYFQILKSFWLILTLKNINIETKDGLYLLQKTILIIIKMMSRPNQIVYKYLKEVGISSKIVELIEDLRLIQKDRLCEVFSQMISLYMQHQTMFQNQKGCQINGVHILGMQSNQKQHILAFCLGLLNSDQPKILENSVSAISSILLRYQYFSHNITNQRVKRLCQLMDSDQRDIHLHTLGIIDNMVFVSAEAVIPIIQNVALLDIVERQLRRQLKRRDNHTSSIVQKCTNIICNITLQVNKQTRKKIYQHPIWQLIFNNLQLDNCLFPLLVTFQYFFEFIPRNKLLPCIEAYCEAIGELEISLLQQNYKNIIRQTLLRVFYLIQDFLSEGMLEKFASIVQNNGLREFLAEELDAIMLQQV